MGGLLTPRSVPPCRETPHDQLLSLVNFTSEWHLSRVPCGWLLHP